MSHPCPDCNAYCECESGEAWNDESCTHECSDTEGSVEAPHNYEPSGFLDMCKCGLSHANFIHWYGLPTSTESDAPHSETVKTAPNDLPKA